MTSPSVDEWGGKFDWYSGSVRDGGAAEVAQLIAQRLDGSVKAIHRPRPRFVDCLELKVGMTSVGWIGSDPVNRRTHFEFKGRQTPLAVTAMRCLLPADHTVCRLDVCADFAGPGTFDELAARVDEAIGDARVVRSFGSTGNPQAGRSWYWGATSSVARLRLYEAGKMRDRRSLNSPDWVRAELQVRPSKRHMKELCANLDPLHVWGLSSWTCRAGRELMAADVPRIASPAEPTSQERRVQHLARTYERTFRALLADLGCWSAVGEALSRHWNGAVEPHVGQ